jgi:hypothetical protein
VNVRLSHHALDRYTDRVKPWLSRDEAKLEIERLLAANGNEPVPSLDYCHVPDVDCFIELADGIALALKWTDASLMAVTCLIRAGGSEEVVAERRRKKRIKKRRSQAQEARERMARGGKPEPTSGPGWPE